MKIYSKYILKYFLQTLLLINILFFTLLTIVTQITLHLKGLNFLESILVIFTESLWNMIKLYDIVILITSIAFIIQIKDYFNYTILRLAGLSILNIFKPVIYTILLIGLLTILLVKPLTIELKNKYNTILYKTHHNTKLESMNNIKFEIMENAENVNHNVKYFINFYVNYDATIDLMSLTNIVIVEYLDGKITNIFKALGGNIDNDKKLTLNNVEIFDVINNVSYKQKLKELHLKNISKKEIKTKIDNDKTTLNGNILNIYDEIKSIRYFDINFKDKLTQIHEFKIDIMNSIASIMIYIFNFLIVLLLFVNERRNKLDFLKEIFVSVLIYIVYINIILTFISSIGTTNSNYIFLLTILFLIFINYICILLIQFRKN